MNLPGDSINIEANIKLKLLFKEQPGFATIMYIGPVTGSNYYDIVNAYSKPFIYTGFKQENTRLFEENTCLFEAIPKNEPLALLRNNHFLTASNDGFKGVLIDFNFVLSRF